MGRVPGPSSRARSTGVGRVPSPRNAGHPRNPDIRPLEEQMETVDGRLDGIDTTLSDHETRITTLENAEASAAVWGSVDSYDADTFVVDVTLDSDGSQVSVQNATGFVLQSGNDVVLVTDDSGSQVVVGVTQGTAAEPPPPHGGDGGGGDAEVITGIRTDDLTVPLKFVGGTGTGSYWSLRWAVDSDNVLGYGRDAVVGTTDDDTKLAVYCASTGTNTSFAGPPYRARHVWFALGSLWAATDIDTLHLYDEVAGTWSADLWPSPDNIYARHSVHVAGNVLWVPGSSGSGGQDVVGFNADGTVHATSGWPDWFLAFGAYLWAGDDTRASYYDFDGTKVGDAYPTLDSRTQDPPLSSSFGNILEIWAPSGTSGVQLYTDTGTWSMNIAQPDRTTVVRSGDSPWRDVLDAGWGMNAVFPVGRVVHEGDLFVAEHVPADTVGAGTSSQAVPVIRNLSQGRVVWVGTDHVSDQSALVARCLGRTSDGRLYLGVYTEAGGGATKVGSYLYILDV